MNSLQLRTNVIIAICLAFTLCGCAGRSAVSVPFSLSRAVNGEVVSLKRVAQDGREARYQTAQSVKTSRHWPRPQRMASAAAVAPRRHAAPPASYHASPGSKPMQRSIGYREDSIPTLSLSQNRVIQTAGGTNDRRSNVRQASQQMQSGPVIIPLENVQPPASQTRSIRTFPASPRTASSASTFPMTQPHSIRPSVEQGLQGQHPQEFGPPELVTRIGEGCGDDPPGRSVDFERLEKLAQRVENMERELSENRSSMSNLTASLASSQREISKLRKEIGFWKSEVVRLEQSMQAQHLSDIESINRITLVLETLLREEAGSVREIRSRKFDLARDPRASGRK